MLDIGIIIGYLAIVLVYGLYRGRNVHTFKDYAVGNRQFTTFAMIATIGATIVGGGSTMNNSSIYYHSVYLFGGRCS